MRVWAPTSASAAISYLDFFPGLVLISSNRPSSSRIFVPKLSACAYSIWSRQAFISFHCSYKCIFKLFSCIQSHCSSPSQVLRLRCLCPEPGRWSSCWCCPSPCPRSAQWGTWSHPSPSTPGHQSARTRSPPDSYLHPDKNTHPVRKLITCWGISRWVFVLPAEFPLIPELLALLCSGSSYTL